MIAIFLVDHVCVQKCFLCQAWNHFNPRRLKLYYHIEVVIQHIPQLWNQTLTTKISAVFFYNHITLSPTHLLMKHHYRDVSPQPGTEIISISFALCPVPRASSRTSLRIFWRFLRAWICHKNVSCRCGGTPTRRALGLVWQGSFGGFEPFGGGRWVDPWRKWRLDV